MQARPVPKLLSWILAAALLVALSPAVLADEQKKEDPKQDESAEKKSSEAGKAKADEEEVVVFTNDDLKRLYGEPEPAPAPPAPAQPAQPGAKPGDAAPQPPANPLEWMENRKAQAQDRAQKIAEAEKALADAQQKVNDLDLRLKALRNPYRARPQISNEERAEWDQMGTAERVKRTEEQLQEARTAAEQARAELQRLRSAS